MFRFAAKANLDLWHDPETHQRVASVGMMQDEAVEVLRADSRFGNVRRTGPIAALDLKASDKGYLAELGAKLQGCGRCADLKSRLPRL
ncbi:adenosylmethionine-8-amino-7-oxononanoate aminotransferase [Bradyrhizobium sp. RT6a]|uniref:hypothetical protein n=1 Tax=Bradyrhizobium sp. RT6a TaxID=3156381 RepID=UPI003392B1B8